MIRGMSKAVLLLSLTLGYQGTAEAFCLNKFTGTTPYAAWGKAGADPIKVVYRLSSDLKDSKFIEAIDKYKKKHNRPFPSWSEVLYVFRKLGYKKS